MSAQSGEDHIVMRYRRAVGWLIVALSFGMAAHGIAGMFGRGIELSDTMFTALGTGAATLVIALLVRASVRREAVR